VAILFTLTFPQTSQRVCVDTELLKDADCLLHLYFNSLKLRVKRIIFSLVCSCIKLLLFCRIRYQKIYQEIRKKTSHLVFYHLKIIQSWQTHHQSHS